MHIWNEKAETMPRDLLEKLQLERLKSTLHHAYNNIPFYRNTFDNKRIKPEDVHSLHDLTMFPFTEKNDLRENYPYGMFAVPLKDIIRIHASSGTTGRPTVVGYTRNDLQLWSELVARMMVAAGTTKNDIIQISFGYGLFTGALGLHYGGELIGATVIPASSGNTRRQLMLMQDFKSTVLVGTPSYAVYLAEALQEMNVDISSLKLRLGLFGAEPCSEKMRSEIERRMNISATDNFGLSEVMGPGVSGECEVKKGMHIAEDYFIAEIINPDTGEVLPPGSKGELVLTTLMKEALPLIRYRTRDLTHIITEPCDCGRTFVRMTKVSGRTDDMLIIRGVNVYPSQIESVLTGIDEVAPHYLLIVTREGALDELEVQVEVTERVFSDEMRKMKELDENIRKRIEEVLGLSIHVKLVEPKTIQRSEGKAKRVIDNRPPL
ncbi:MAG: phenylacetate--CoA ligase [Patescibacteria group bacterium]|nr:phenylacetate--CoA ligase [Patescibacteria group bacterium]